MITVCAACCRSCCWQGYFMCDEASEAATILLRVEDVQRLALESPDYWQRQTEVPQKALVERMRKAIAKKKSTGAPVRPAVFTLPPYDDIYFEGLRVMKEDEDY